MRREWRLNPPPNWPVKADAAVGLDWRPDPAWGPPPVGWHLWQRRRVGIGAGHRVFGTAALGLVLGAVALVGALLSEPAAPNPPVQQQVTTAQHQAAMFGTAGP